MDDLFKCFLQKLQALHGNLVAGGLDSAPDGGGARDDFNVSGEALNQHVAFIANALEGLDDGLPVALGFVGLAAGRAGWRLPGSSRA